MFKRRATIEVHNKTKFKWEALNAAFSSGASESVLPGDVMKDEIIKYTGVQRSFSIFTGTAGVFTYSILDDDGKHWKTLAVMWDVPFDHEGNYWNIREIGTINEPASHDLFWRLRNHEANPVKGEDGWKQLSTANFTIKGYMSSHSDSKLIIIVSDYYKANL